MCFNLNLYRVESLSMINELELPRVSIGSKFSKNEFGQNKLEE